MWAAPCVQDRVKLVKINPKLKSFRWWLTRWFQTYAYGSLVYLHWKAPKIPTSLGKKTKARFPKGCTTLDNLIRLETAIKLALNNNLVTTEVFLDLFKAHDITWINGLVYKLTIVSKDRFLNGFIGSQLQGSSNVVSKLSNPVFFQTVI